jgi:hypothetical protein
MKCGGYARVSHSGNLVQAGPLHSYWGIAFPRTPAKAKPLLKFSVGWRGDDLLADMRNRPAVEEDSGADLCKPSEF